ncbi:hypothetical protein B4109_0033 [Geobacillus stearothermophilus]|uniref:Uncharacterized protein n=1 Tax=Geobacillus stearothermophilus TaxID=1422 RepID=A0A150M9I7_GEOSE|nr:hypothetical protein B4109_0033 [Geobacillus stearothermophilus]
MKNNGFVWFLRNRKERSYSVAKFLNLPPVLDKWKDLNRKIVDHYYRLGKSYLHHTPLAFAYKTYQR